MKKSFLFTIFLQILLCSSTFAQQQEYFQGQILDSKTQQPIPFVTISYSSNYFGVISNEDGSFILPVNNKDSSLFILIRCVGYEQKSINKSDIKPSILNVFHINPKTYEINEVLVKGKRLESKSPNEIVSLAVNRIDKNYPNHHFLLNGYYRDYLKINNNYINLFEANVEVEDLGFNTNEVDQTKINLIYGTFNNSFTIDFTKVIDYGKNKVIPYGRTKYVGGNEFFFLLQHDPIRNYRDQSFDFIKNIQSDFLNDHKFKIAGIEYIDDTPCYKIEFKYYKPGSDEFKTGYVKKVVGEKDKINSYIAKGQIYIQTDTYRIHRLVYQVYHEVKSRVIKLWELNLEYRDRDDVSYLNYISFNNMVEIPEWDDKGYFYHRSTEVDKQNKTLNLIFNNKVDFIAIKNFKNYKLEYDGNRLKIDNITISDTCVILTIQKFDELFGSFEMNYSSRLNVKVKNIKDCYGNEVNDIKSLTAYQYREFFVNDVRRYFQSIPNDQCLDQVKSMILSSKKNGNMPNGVYFNSPLIDKKD